MKSVQKHILRNKNGDEVLLINLGAGIASIRINMPEGPREIVLGHRDLEQYLTDTYYLGSTVGRYANRINGATYFFDGEVINLSANEGMNQLHGGDLSFHKRFWTLDSSSNSVRAQYQLQSEDGDQGYPGTVLVAVTYSWSDDRVLTISYSGVTDRPTPLNLTNHSYFNLDPGQPPIDHHKISITADFITEFNDDFTATGKFYDVLNGPLDLNSLTNVSDLLQSDHDLVSKAGGLDFNYVLSGNEAVATLTSASGDLSMGVSTNYPGIQLYSGQYLGLPFSPNEGVCLEPQFYPGSPNYQHFPNCMLMPGQRYDKYIEFSFQINDH